MKKEDRKIKALEDEYDLVPETTGKIINGIYKRKDNRALIISFAWGGILRFCPESEIQNEKRRIPSQE